jgi:hypothetical protein
MAKIKKQQHRTRFHGSKKYQNPSTEKIEKFK